jgi:hypothetical protein
MSGDNKTPIILSAGSLHHTGIPEHANLDEVRNSAKSLEEATMPLTPDLKQFLDRWRMALMNNKRVVGPINKFTQKVGLDPRNPPGATPKR